VGENGAKYSHHPYRRHATEKNQSQSNKEKHRIQHTEQGSQNNHFMVKKKTLTDVHWQGNQCPSQLLPFHAVMSRQGIRALH